jgi:rhamnosyltransferase
MQKIVAVIVTYNPSVVELRGQFDAIISEGISIILVDNASANFGDIESKVLDVDPALLSILRNAANLGLAEGQNLGLAQARRQNASHVIFFDQDSIPQMGFKHALLSTEVELTRRGIKFSAIGPAAFDPTTLKYYPITKYVGPFIRRHYPVANEPIEATFLISSGTLIRMSVLDEVGAMRSELFIDYIDVEWCLRAKSFGYRCFVASAARMSHRIGDSRLFILGRTISAHSPFRRYYLVRNSFLMLRLRYVPISYKLREISLNFLRVSLFLYLSTDRHGYLRLMHRAVADGIAGRYGKQL